MSERDPQPWSRFALSVLALLALGVAAPIGLIAAARSRFGSANPLSGADPPWRWGSDQVGDAITGPIADDTVIDGIIRLSLCVGWIALAVIVVTTLVEVVHAVRHHGLGLPEIRGVGWAQRVARFIAVGLVAVLPLMTSSTSLASTLDARAVAAASTDPPIPSPFGASVGTRNAPTVAPSRAESTSTPSTNAAIRRIHVVAPGESIYSIAVDLSAGDSSRVLDIADELIDANVGAVMPGGQRFTNPAYIEAGWQLQIPTDIADPRADDDGSGPVAVAATYTVEDGDTLWDIADEQLGDPAAWPEIWERNAGDDMGGGRTFDDPDLILPGWELELDDTEPATASTPSPAPVSTTVPDDSEDEPSSTPAEGTAHNVHTHDVGTLDAAATVDTAARSDVDVNGPLPLTPNTAAAPIETAATSTATATTTANTSPATTSTAPGAAAGGAGSQDPSTDVPSPGAPSPIRLEHAALVAAGLLALVGVRRRQRLRSAMPRHRVPTPRDEVTNTERRLRTIDAGERVLRVDVACRAAARSLIGADSQIGWVEVSTDGDVEVRLTAAATLPLPWTGDGQLWRLGAEVPIEMLSEDARQVGQPCVALVQLGVTSAGSELLVDLEACGVLAIAARPELADEVVTALATAVASSQFAEVAHLVAVSVPETALLHHRNAHITGSADAAVELACSLAGSTALNERSSFDLRSLRTGGEMWEPAVVLLRSADGGADAAQDGRLPGAGHGLAIVLADEQAETPSRLVGRSDGWQLEAFGGSVDLLPIGVSADELADIGELLVDADRTLEPVDPTDEIQWADQQDSEAGPLDAEEHGDSGDAAVPFEPRPHEIVVGLLGGVEVHTRTGEAGSFQRSKTVELIAWLTTHRDRATRTGARTALWDLDVRDATFANVVSEARRALARLVPPPDGEEWVARTLTDQLPVHDLVVTDAELVEDRLAHARLQPPGQALETLRAAVELVRDLPFAGTSYLWPDAEGITSNLVLLAISATAEFAAHALSLGDTDAVFWATGKGLRVLPGHEELIALRMQAHARSGDLAGVRQEWESYERVLVADAWSDGEPAPKMLALRRELL